MLNPPTAWMFRWTAAGVLALAGFVGTLGAQQSPNGVSVPTDDAPHHALVNQYCLSCHNSRTQTAGLALDTISAEDLDANWEAWEKVVRKLRARQMPPAGGRRPDEAAYRAALASLESALDSVAAATPNPGRTDTFRRLNRTEYQNAIRDLLALDVDVASLLPSDSSSYGFDKCDGRHPLPHLVGALRLGGGEDQPVGGRATRPRAPVAPRSGPDPI